MTTCSRIELIDQKSASITRRTVKLVCVAKFTHSRVYTRVPVYRFTLQLLTYNLSSKFHFTMFWCLASGNLSIVFYSRLLVRCRKESSRSLSHPLMSFLYLNQAIWPISMNINRKSYYKLSIDSKIGDLDWPWTALFCVILLNLAAVGANYVKAVADRPIYC